MLRLFFLLPKRPCAKTMGLPDARVSPGREGGSQRSYARRTVPRAEEVAAKVRLG